MKKLLKAFLRGISDAFRFDSYKAPKRKSIDEAWASDMEAVGKDLRSAVDSLEKAAKSKISK